MTILSSFLLPLHLRLFFSCFFFRLNWLSIKFMLRGSVQIRVRNFWVPPNADMWFQEKVEKHKSFFRGKNVGGESSTFFLPLMEVGMSLSTCCHLLPKTKAWRPFVKLCLGLPTIYDPSFVKFLSVGWSWNFSMDPPVRDRELRCANVNKHRALFFDWTDRNPWFDGSGRVFRDGKTTGTWRVLVVIRSKDGEVESQLSLSVSFREGVRRLNFLSRAYGMQGILGHRESLLSQGEKQSVNLRFSFLEKQTLE